MRKVPDPVERAVASKVDLFIGVHCEWKFDLAVQRNYVEALAECPVLVFADNGYGDHLFLKANVGDSYDLSIHEYSHEGSVITGVDDELARLLDLEERTTFQGHLSTVVYESGEEAKLGDRVKIKVWAQFWKGWQDGSVVYVPGVSPMKPQFEYGGLKMVAIRFGDGEICPLVDPSTGVLRKVRFVAHAPATPPNAPEKASAVGGA